MTIDEFSSHPLRDEARRDARAHRAHPAHRDGRSGANAALLDGTVQPHGFALDLVEVPVLVQAFRRMVRGLEFDCTEMAVTTYLVAREHGVRFTALPVFLVRGFHHGAVQVLAGPRASRGGQLAGSASGSTAGTP